MRSDHVMVVSAGVSPATVQQTLQILEDHGLQHRSVGAAEVIVDPLSLSVLPALCIVHSATRTVELVEVLRRLVRQSAPTVVVLDEGSEEHEVTLLQSGAWEVFTLSRTSERRLRARIAALHHNLTTMAPEPPTMVFEVGNMRVDLPQATVTVAGRPVRLSLVEFELLSTLVRAPDRVSTVDELAAVLAERDDSGRPLRDWMDELRLKIESAGGPVVAKSPRRANYTLVA